MTVMSEFELNIGLVIWICDHLWTQQSILLCYVHPNQNLLNRSTLQDWHMGCERHEYMTNTWNTSRTYLLFDIEGSTCITEPIKLCPERTFKHKTFIQCKKNLVTIIDHVLCKSGPKQEDLCMGNLLICLWKFYTEARVSAEMAKTPYKAYCPLSSIFPKIQCCPQNLS